MATFIIVIFSLAGVFFVWEAIIAPSIRLNLRYQMFAERDRLRDLQVYADEDVDVKAFEYAHLSINSGIRAVHSFNILALFYVLFVLHNDKGLRDRLARRERLVNDCGNTQLREIMNRTAGIVFRSMLINSLGFLVVFVLPFALVVICAKLVNKWVVRFLLMPLHELEKITVPSSTNNQSAMYS